MKQFTSSYRHCANAGDFRLAQLISGVVQSLGS
jgi:hypothetical protein